MPLHTHTTALAALVLLLVVLGGGCTRPAEDDAKRITFSIWGSVQQQVAEREIIGAFRKENPDITVDLMLIGGRYPDKIQAMMVGNVAPDVIMIEMVLYDEWASRGVLLDLTDEFRRIDAETPFMPIPQQAFAREDGIFALPVNCHGIATYCNFDALEKAGVTIPEEGLSWDFIMEVGERLSRRAGSKTASADYAVMMPPPITIFWQHGVELFDDLTNPTEVTVNTPEAIEAVDFLRRLLQSGFAVPPEVIADQGTFQLFRDGRVVFFFNGRWMTPELAGRTSFDWDIVPYPRGPRSNITMHGGTGLGIWSGSPREEAARRFVNFYASAKGAEIAMHWQRTAPPFRDLAYSEEFLSLRPPESMHHFSETMEEGAAMTMLYSPGSQEVTRIFEGRMEQAMANPNMPAAEVVAGLESDLVRWLSRKEKGRL